MNCLHGGAGAGLLAGALITSEMHCRIQNTAEDTGGEEGGKRHQAVEFYRVSHEFISFPQKGIFNNSFPIAVESGILPEFGLQGRAGRIANLIFSPDIMDVILCRTDF